MFDIAAFDAEIAGQFGQAGGQDDVLLTQALREPAAESGVKHLSATSVFFVAAILISVQGGPALFGGNAQPSASLDPSALETYAMHLDAPQSSHDLVSLFDSLNRS